MIHSSDADMASQASGPALTSLHYGYPAAVFVYYMASSTVAVCTLQTQSSEQTNGRRRIITWLLFFSILTYFAQLCSLLTQAVIQHSFPSDQDLIIGLLSCILVFGVVTVGLSGSENPVWHPIVGTLWMALAFEPMIEGLSLLSQPLGELRLEELVDIGLVAVRYLAFVLATIFFFEGAWSAKKETGTDAERQSLLKPAEDEVPDANRPATDEASGGQQQNGYGSTPDETSTASADATKTATSETVESPWEKRQRLAKEQMEKRLKEKGNWFTYAKSFLVFFPYIWPVNNRPLQIRIGLVGICLLTMNFVNVLIPRQMGILIDSLGGDNSYNPWSQVLVFGALKLIASEAGLSLVRQWLWIPVEFYSYDAMSTAAYSHILNLSSDFHDAKSSSDIMMAISSGQSVSNMLDSICFRAIPMVIDMTVAFTYLSVTFGPYEGFITIATSVVFMYIATSMIARLKSARKKEVSAWFEEHYVRQAGIQGWTTVTCFNQIPYEERRYSEAVRNRVAKSQEVQFGYIVSYAFQFLVLLSGLIAGAFLAVYQVTTGAATPGKFIMLLTYWSQLVAPLTFFASLGKSISRDLIGAEQLLEIMQTKPTIIDKEGAPQLEFSGGHVKFDKVCFSYDKKKEILKDVSFTATPGMTVAFVGATGAGKSTILKLLDRFYDVTSGAILIDGQDIREVNLSSLRNQIGVVPQSPVLFDDTVMNNVRYAKLDATDEEVFEACKAASIHEQILGFSDGMGSPVPKIGYQTRVGERGIKLSGGELQRVAIARAILKRPSIVLLDEATSAVDTETEQKIQEALRQLCEGRTTFIVAHRLSTIMNADRIMVITGGELVEEGSHEELIGANGKYAELWSRQIFVKTKDTNSKEDKPATKDRKVVDFVNDLPSEVAEVELAKVKATAGSSADDPASGESSGSEDSEDSTDTLVTPGHRKEASTGSRLRPDAPTFTPRAMRPVVSVGPPSPVRPNPTGVGYFSGALANPTHMYFAAPLVMVPATYPVFQPLMHRAPVKQIVAGSSESTARLGYDGISQRSSENTIDAGSVQQDLDDPFSEPVQGTFKRPVYSRRIQSKSEPVGSEGAGTTE